jgi:type II secretory ATPase GspE/PulE/Tfp pilus assembly ATPase PilB-like protein
LRILDRSSIKLHLDRIDYAPQDRERLLKAIRSPWGLVLLTGPTGSGKTTVLYATLNEITDDKRKVMSIEDPVEFLLPGVVQAGLNPRKGLTFAAALRGMLRSDPDVLMVGEVRDFETLMVSMQSALTGHLVLTTLHANDTPGGLKRMVDMGVDPFVVADATKLVMSQRLVRLVCKECAVAAEPDANQLELAAEMARSGSMGWPPAAPQWKKAVGCDKCAHTGYRGRTVVAEMLEVTPEIGKAMREGASRDELQRIAVSQGMTTMGADGVRRAARGETTLDEVIRVTR